MARAQGVPLPAPVDASSPSRGAALLRRILTVLIFLPVFLLIVMAGPAWLFGITVVLIGAAAQWEFTGMFERSGIRTFRVLGLIGGMVVTASFVRPGWEWLAVSTGVSLADLDRAGITAAILAVLVAPVVWRHGARIAWEPVAITALGVCYVNWLVGYGAWLRDLPSGKDWVLLLIWVTWLGETAAYLVGSTMGRRPLAPAISPKKTVEGAIAQFAVSIAAALVGQALFFTATLSREDAVVVGAVLGVVGQFGDLAESVLKRSAGAKDSGSLMPGHGGMLDRIDSLLFNTPVLFYYASHGRILTP